MKTGTVDTNLPLWVLGCDPSGPYSLEQVRLMWAAGQLLPDQQYCQEGMKTWCSLSDIQAALGGSPLPAGEAPKVIPLRPAPIRISGRPAASPSETSFERGYSHLQARRTLRFKTHL
jgi:hypothetical protein